MVEYPILEKDENFIKEFVSLILYGISNKDVKINFTRNGYSLGIKTDFEDSLKKEFPKDEKNLKGLIASLFEIYVSLIHEDESIKKLKEKYESKLSLILSMFPKDTTEDIFLKSKSTGSFLENIRWNLIKLEDTSETKGNLPQFKYAEITFEYSNPQTHIDHYETITLKVSKKELIKIIKALNEVDKKLKENEH